MPDDPPDPDLDSYRRAVAAHLMRLTPMLMIAEGAAAFVRCRRLERELEWVRAERDDYARVALAGLSGLVGTPERGYVEDGGPGQLADDLRRLRAELAAARGEGADV